MVLKSTRFELTIVGAAFLVLLLCRQPPKSGNASIVRDAGVMLRQPDRGQKMEDSAVAVVSSAADNQPAPEVSSPIAGISNVATSDNTSASSTTPPQPKLKRIAVVDATKCKGLNYKDLMYGEVTVEWVWEGGRQVPKKVCQVREPSGVISTWSFDNNDGIVITELPPEPADK
jgi:hypothetical protein